MRERRARAGDRLAERAVEREAQPVAGDGLVQRGRGAVGAEVEPGGGRLQWLMVEVGGAADLVARLAGGRAPERQHRAARELEHGSASWSTVRIRSTASPSAGASS